ncbi:MAG: hypothetical protein GKR94_24870 [Gammaproteobacteria bacterium]|nr:hypothetical protein [Gammaproteobacteria bacterium]
MAKFKVMIGLLALTTVAVAQNFEQQVPQLRLQEFQQVEFGTIGQGSNLKRFQMSVPNLKLQVPKQYTGNDRAKIYSLFSELKQACPECTTGGTIGGDTVTGGNTEGNYTILFPINTAVTIPKTEYGELGALLI